MYEFCARLYQRKRHDAMFAMFKVVRLVSRISVTFSSILRQKLVVFVKPDSVTLCVTSWAQSQAGDWPTAEASSCHCIRQHCRRVHL